MPFLAIGDDVQKALCVWHVVGVAGGDGFPRVAGRISRLVVSEACWAGLITPGGATIFQGIVDPGTSKIWTERQPVTLESGDPGAVTLTMDSKNRTGLGPDPITLSPGTRSGISRVAPVSTAIPAESMPRS